MFHGLQIVLTYVGPDVQRDHPRLHLRDGLLGSPAAGSSGLPPSPLDPARVENALEGRGQEAVLGNSRISLVLAMCLWVVGLRSLDAGGWLAHPASAVLCEAIIQSRYFRLAIC